MPVTILYRYFDAEGHLLYVGITDCLSIRNKQHSATAHWHKLVDEIKVKQFPDRPSALIAEGEAIRNENPIYNVNRGHRDILDVEGKPMVACEHCGTLFELKRKDSKTCSRSCTSKRWRKQNPEKQREYERRWREANPEFFRNKQRLWRENNLDKVRENNTRNARLRREANPEKAKAKASRYYKENAEKLREQSRLRYEANAEKLREQARRRRRENPDKIREAARLRYAAKKVKTSCEKS